jgi:thioredoxin-related protein
MKKFMVVALVSVLMAGQSAVGADEGWIVDFQEAQKRAAEEGKSILMEFTGSDWCPPCKKLKAEVLDTDVFKTKTPEHYILLKLDNPRDKSHQSEEEIAQYQKLSAEYKVRGVPTIILADPQGKPFAQMVGYGGEPADAYVKRLTDQAAVREQRDAALAKAEQASGLERARLLDKAVSVVEPDLVVAQYDEVVQQIIVLDANDEAGLKSKYQGLVQLNEVRAALQEARSSASTPQEVIEKLDDLITQLQPTGVGLQEVLYQKGAMQFAVDKEASKATFEAALKVAPDSPMARQIEQVINLRFPKEEPESP